MKILAMSNQKGGVGKTTSTVNTADALARLGLRVLVVDSDPQANASSSLGVSIGPDDLSLYEVLMEPETIRSAIFQTQTEGLHLLPAGRDLAGGEVELVNEFGRETRLKKALSIVEDQYDVVMIDCPPSLGLLTINALTAATGVVIPLQCEYFALEGLSQLMKTIEQVRSHLNPSLEVTGILLTMFDTRNNICHQVAQDITEHFSWAVFETVVPRNVRLSEAPSFGMTVLQYDDTSKGSMAYSNLSRELAGRLALGTAA